MSKAAMVLGMAAIIGGCAAAKPVTLTSAFDAQQARQLVQPGTNTITGSALIRQNGGGVVSCAGLTVTLLPATAYATERVAAVYGNTQRGYRPIYAPISFTPAPPEFGQHIRETMCDTQGRFTFDRVADGDFYVETSITWQVRHTPQGGGLMQVVSVQGGESKDVVLSP